MKCKLCDKEIDTITLYSFFIEEDHLCKECRDKLNYKHRHFSKNGLDIEYFYDYNSLFKTLLIQYKECFDEALYDTFLYKIDMYINIKYHNYKVLYVPSSNTKLNKRGFDHLKKMFSSINLKEVKGLEMINDISQVGKTLYYRKQMETNYLYKGWKIGNVLIVDDVYTTGSSLIGVYNAIKPYANKVKALVLSKA